MSRERVYLTLDGDRNGDYLTEAEGRELGYELVAWADDWESVLMQTHFRTWVVTFKDGSTYDIQVSPADDPDIALAEQLTAYGDTIDSIDSYEPKWNLD